VTQFDLLDRCDCTNFQKFNMAAAAISKIQ